MLNFTNLTLKLLRTPVKLKTGLEILTKKKKKTKVEEISVPKLSSTEQSLSGFSPQKDCFLVD